MGVTVTSADNHQDNHLDMKGGSGTQTFNGQTQPGQFLQIGGGIGGAQVGGIQTKNDGSFSFSMPMMPLNLQNLRMAPKYYDESLYPRDQAAPIIGMYGGMPGPFIP